MRFTNALFRCVVITVFVFLVGAISPALVRADGVFLPGEEAELVAQLVGDPAQQRNSSLMAPDPVLTAVARARAADMAKRRYFSHVNPDGLGPNHLVRAAGYELPAWWSGGRSGNFIESIGAGYPTASLAWQGWMNSSGHRTHLLASKSFYRDQTRFGIGAYADPASPFRRYWVIITAPPEPGPVAAFAADAREKPPRVALSSTVPGRKSAAPAAKTAPVPRAKVLRLPWSAKLWNWPE